MPPDFAPDTPEFYAADPDAAFAQLRATDPVHWYEAGGFWCLTRQAEIREVSRHPELFSSARGTQMFQIPEVRGGHDPLPIGPEGEHSIIEMDPPDHGPLRRLVVSAFTPRYVQKLEERIREITTASLDAIDATAEVDFVEQIAVPLPMLVIAEMIGLPAKDSAAFRRWSDSIVEAGGGGFNKDIFADLIEMFEYFSSSLVTHREVPHDDLITLLQEAEIEAAHLTEGEVLVFLMTLLVAGNETTRNLIAGGAEALAEHPDQLAWLAEDPTRIPGAVEELLRWVSPVRSFVRCATADTTLGGTSVKTGDHLVMFYGSANRDEAVFGPTADRLDLSRDDANHHLAFGFGEHVCLGGALARIEARIMFEELLARWPSWQITGDPVRLESVLMNGLVHLPARFAGP